MTSLEKMEMAPWASAELCRKRWSAWRAEFFSRVRLVFILLFGVTLFIFVSNHQMQLQAATTRELHAMMKRSALQEHLRRNAMDYEKSVDQINP